MTNITSRHSLFSIELLLVYTQTGKLYKYSHLCYKLPLQLFKEFHKVQFSYTYYFYTFIGLRLANRLWIISTFLYLMVVLIYLSWKVKEVVSFALIILQNCVLIFLFNLSKSLTVTLPLTCYC